MVELIHRRLWESRMLHVSGAAVRAYEFVRHGREVLRHQGREVTIFTQREKILLVQCVNDAIGIVLDDLI
jgi:hypothetical protein